MKDEIYAPEWVLSPDYCAYPNDEYVQKMREMGNKSMKEICEKIAKQKLGE